MEEDEEKSRSVEMRSDEPENKEPANKDNIPPSPAGAAPSVEAAANAPEAGGVHDISEGTTADPGAGTAKKGNGFLKDGKPTLEEADAGTEGSDLEVEPGKEDISAQEPAGRRPEEGETPPGTGKTAEKEHMEPAHERVERILNELDEPHGAAQANEPVPEKAGGAPPGGKPQEKEDWELTDEEEMRLLKDVNERQGAPVASARPAETKQAMPEPEKNGGTKRLGVLLAVLVGALPPALIIIGYIYQLHFHLLLLYSLTLYGFLTLLHVILQMAFAGRELHVKAGSTGYKPGVSVIIPVYNEDPDMFEKCLMSIGEQKGLDVEVIIANDGSKEYIRQIFDKRKLPGWVFLDLKHGGKREAMYAGFKAAKGEIVVFGDSDTIFERNCFFELVQPFADPRIGATSGNVRIYNNRTFLARLSDFRYWIAFNLERAAQSRFGVMSCVSGPCGGYRKTVLDKVIDRWLNQVFLGKRCTYGDDRHLTNLVLLEGYRTKYVVSAHARTLFPPTTGQWIKQQLRWSRSFYREYIVNIRSFHKHSAWLPYDLTYQALFPLFVLFNITLMFLTSLLVSYSFIALYVMLIIIFAFIRSLYGMAHTGKAGFLSLVLYGFVYVGILLPLKVYAILTMGKVGWGTQPRNGYKAQYSNNRSVISFW